MASMAAALDKTFEATDFHPVASSDGMGLGFAALVRIAYGQSWVATAQVAVNCCPSIPVHLLL